MSAVKNMGLMDMLAARWGGLASRERALVGSAIALVAAALMWWVGISPALTQLRQARAAAPALDAQLQLMRAQAAQATSLKAQRALSYDESLRSLESTVKAAGAPGAAGASGAAGAVATLAVSDARASITLRGISGDALAQMLSQLRSNARLVPSELRLKQSATSAAPTTPSTTPQTSTAWDGTMVLSLPAR